MHDRIIIFTFAGRRANMELQLPFIRRILAEYPDCEYHVWDLALDPVDHEYLQTIRGDRISVHTDFYNDTWGQGWTDYAVWRGQFNNVHQHYTRPEYQDCLFVKIDDDVVFIESDRFGIFLDMVDANRGSIVSARIVNHRSDCNPDVVHHDFLERWRELVDQPVELTPCTDWLAINLVGYDWVTGGKIASGCGGDPEHIPCVVDIVDGVVTEVRVVSVGDEDAANTLPRFVLNGFVACHLYFGLQRAVMSEDQIAGLQKRYSEIGEQYRERKQ